ncbi:hypothetical protein PoB_004347500, partial [Plakobranchus ocellatus]
MGKVPNVTTMVNSEPKSPNRNNQLILSVKTDSLHSERSPSYQEKRLPQQSSKLASYPKDEQNSMIYAADFPSRGFDNLRIKRHKSATHAVRAVSISRDEPIARQATLQLRSHRRKRCSVEAVEGKCISVLTFKRKRTDDDAITGEPGTDPSSWTRDKDLSPVACGLDHVVPLK